MSLDSTASPPTRKRKVVIATSVNPEVADEIDRRASAAGKSTAGYIRVAVHDYLRQFGYEPEPDADEVDDE